MPWIIMRRHNQTGEYNIYSDAQADANLTEVVGSLNNQGVIATSARGFHTQQEAEDFIVARRLNNSPDYTVLAVDASTVTVNETFRDGNHRQQTVH